MAPIQTAQTLAGTVGAAAVTGPDSNTATLAVGSYPDLSLSKSVSPTPYWYHGQEGMAGAGPLYTIETTNSGSAATSGAISIEDTLPIGVVVNNGAAGAVSLQSNTGSWACNSDSATPQKLRARRRCNQCQR